MQFWFWFPLWLLNANASASSSLSENSSLNWQHQLRNGVLSGDFSQSARSAENRTHRWHSAVELAKSLQSLICIARGRSAMIGGALFFRCVFVAATAFVLY